MIDGLIKRPLDEEFDTMMEVQRNPTGAWMAIQEQADRIEALVADREALITARKMMGRQWAKDAESRLAAEARAEQLAATCEELVKERDEALERLDYWVEAQPEKDREYREEQVARQIAEAKLTNAVEVLRHYATCPVEEIRREARAVLAELEGE